MRLFVALDLPVEARGRLGDWAAAAAPKGVRRVPAENLHVTLAFLGARDERGALAAGELIAPLARRLGPLCSAGALWLPTRRPSVLAIALQDDDALTSLHGELVAGLAAAIGFEPEQRPFRPHVTVGRVARATRIDPHRALEPPAPELAFEPCALTLYRSHTAPAGARYEALRRAVLPPT